MKPDQEGWWWVRSADDHAVDGWLPVWVFVGEGRVVGDDKAGQLVFWEECRGGWVSVDGHAWSGAVLRDGGTT